MKAILVIDIDEKHIGKIGTEIQIINQKYNCKWELKPMPKKKNTPLTEYNLIEAIYENGWNDCLDEINATENGINAKNVALKGETE